MLISKNRYIYIENENVIKICKKMILNYDNKRERISDIDVESEKRPNILVYKSSEERIDYENIYKSVRILVSDYSSIGYKNYENIPENIEYIIVDGEEYRNDKRNKLELRYFMNTKEIIEYIEEKIIREDKIDEETSRGESIIDIIIFEIFKISELNYKIKENIERIFIEIIEKVDKRLLNKIYEHNYTILNYIENEMIILRLINRMNKEIINNIDREGDNLRFKMYLSENILMEILEYMTEDNINKKKENGMTALIINCYHNNNNMCIELINRMKKDVIESIVKISGNSALIAACDKNMENVALEIIKKVDKKHIKHKNIYGKTAEYYALQNKMYKVLELL